MRKILFLYLVTIALPFCGGGQARTFLTPHPETPLWSMVETSPQKVLAAEIKTPEDRVALGFALYRLGKLREAFQQFQMANQEGESEFSLLGMGMVKEAEGNLLEAYTYYIKSQHPLARARAERIKKRALNQALSSDQPSEIAKGLLIDPQDKRVYLALGNYYLRHGKPFLARAYIKKGIETVGEDEALLRLLELSYEQEDDLEGALEVARRLYQLYPSPGNLRAVQQLEERLEEERIRKRLKDLQGKPVITRGDLALMIDAYLGKYFPPRKPPIIVDLYRSQQMEAILRVTSAGIMKVYPNHTFQPDAEVRRISLAKILYRLVKKLGISLEVNPVVLRDTSSRYAVFAVGAGLMDEKDGNFKPYDTVSFTEAEEALRKLRNWLKEQQK